MTIPSASGHHFVFRMSAGLRTFTAVQQLGPVFAIHYSHRVRFKVIVICTDESAWDHSTANQLAYWGGADLLNPVNPPAAPCMSCESRLEGPPLP